MQAFLGIIQVLQQILPAGCHAEIKILGAATDKGLQAGIGNNPDAGLSQHRIHRPLLQGGNGGPRIAIGQHLRPKVLLLHKLPQAALHDACHRAQPLAVKGCRSFRYGAVPAALQEDVLCLSHGQLRIQKLPGTLLRPGQPCKNINLPLKEHLIQLREGAVHILISPIGIRSQPLIILIAVAPLHIPLAGPLLPVRLLIIRHPDDLLLIIALCHPAATNSHRCRRNSRGQQPRRPQPDCPAEAKNPPQPASPCPPAFLLHSRSSPSITSMVFISKASRKVSRKIFLKKISQHMAKYQKYLHHIL